MRGRRYTKDEKEKIVSLYNKGVPLKKLSRCYRLEVQTLRLWVNRLKRIKINKLETISVDEINRLKKDILLIRKQNKILKKAHEHILAKKDLNKKIEIIKKNRNVHSIKTMCLLLKVNRSTFYKSVNRGESKRERENKTLKKIIYELYIKSKGKYGSIKIYKILTKRGYLISLKRVQNKMKEMKLHLKKRKRYKALQKGCCKNKLKNLLNRNFKTKNINEKWLGDITYIYTKKNGWCYLASVLELHTRKIIGYSLSTAMTTDLVIKALDMACKNKKSLKGLIFHSDLGSQYTSYRMKMYCSKLEITQSFSKRGCPYDNAPMEAFHSILKKEEVYLNSYNTFNDAYINLSEFIEIWYNKKRIHSSINYMTPYELESLIIKNII
ncbi:MAG: IS3 family transposase [Clostridium perfringens]|nr:IS3 family transposase [Clostridium perfringens]